MSETGRSMLDRTHQAHILVVDDEADVRLLLAREISDRGHEVVAVSAIIMVTGPAERGKCRLERWVI